MINESLTTLTLPYDDSRTKTVRVFVPAHGEGEKFPVIYMTDGQNLFDEESSSFGSWHTREAVRAELESGGRGAVIVGIHNDEDPKTRASELMPKGIGTLVGPEEIIRSFTPAGEAFDSFVIDTVIPEIEKSFPVLTGRENTAFCGSSSGGMMSLFTALSHPDVYGAAGVLARRLVPLAQLFAARRKALSLSLLGRSRQNGAGHPSGHRNGVRNAFAVLSRKTVQKGHKARTAP